MSEIKGRFSGHVMFKSKTKTLKELVVFQVKRGANLWGANLNVKHPPINSHQFISEVLWRQSKTESQKDFSARIRVETGGCWEFFIKLARKKKVLKWAMKILFQWDEFKEKWEELK